MALSQWFQGVTAPLGDTCNVGDILIIMSRWALLAPGRGRDASKYPTMHRVAPQLRIIQPPMSVVRRLKPLF